MLGFVEVFVNATNQHGGGRPGGTPCIAVICAREWPLAPEGSASAWAALERRGYVRRTMGRNARRRVGVELTRKAQRIEQQIFGPLLAQVGELLQSYSETDLDLIHDFLQRVRSAVSAAGTRKDR